MLAQAGRECNIFSLQDVVPIALLYVVDFCCRVVAFGVPIQNCEWVINETDLQAHNSIVPRAGAFVAWVMLSIIGAAMLSVLEEMWHLWDPLGKSTNVYSWSLGIASEIDHMLNEFYEHDTSILVRKHAYMDASVQLNGPLMNDSDDNKARQTI